jgi:hypothetical protein
MGSRKSPCQMLYWPVRASIWRCSFLPYVELYHFSFYRTVSFSAKNCTIKLVFRCAFFFTSYYTVFQLMVIFECYLVFFQWDSVVFYPFRDIFQCDSVVFHYFSVRFGSFSPYNGNFQCTN